MAAVTLKERYQEISESYSKKTRREQIMILVAALVISFLPTYMYFVDPIFSKIKREKMEQTNAQDRTAEIQNEINSIMVMLQSDPAVALNEEKERIKQKIAAIDKELTVNTVDLISAFEMPAMLRSVLANASGLKLVSVSNSAPTLLVEKSGNGSVSLYRHETKIVLKGSYMATLGYLQLLENLDKKFMWGPFSFAINEYPEGTIEINVYTLSSNKDFIRG